MWTSLVFRQIVIDVADIPHRFIPDIPGLEFLHHILHEVHCTNRTICLCLSIVDLCSCRYKQHLDWVYVVCK